ncbi:hypothetical protein MPSEU_000986700 [Mayamaea pseudoterrestris]|nr:hypothetical protein MPSEU_000986700 [Mayamaea pseudoterrestris]
MMLGLTTLPSIEAFNSFLHQLATNGRGVSSWSGHHHPPKTFGIVPATRSKETKASQLHAHRFDFTNSYLSSLSGSGTGFTRTKALFDSARDSGETATASTTTSTDDDGLDLELLQSQAGGARKRKRKLNKKQASTRQVKFVEPSSKDSEKEKEANNTKGAAALSTNDFAETDIADSLQETIVEARENALAESDDVAGTTLEPDGGAAKITIDAAPSETTINNSADADEQFESNDAPDKPLEIAFESETNDSILAAPDLDKSWDVNGASMKESPVDATATDEDETVSASDDEESISLVDMDETTAAIDPVDDESLAVDAATQQSAKESKDAIQMDESDQLSPIADLAKVETTLPVDEEPGATADLVEDEPAVEPEQQSDATFEQDLDADLDADESTVLNDYTVTKENEQVESAAAADVAAPSVEAKASTSTVKKSFAPGNSSGGYKIVSDSGFLGGLSGKSIVIQPVAAERSYENAADLTADEGSAEFDEPFASFEQSTEPITGVAEKETIEEEVPVSQSDNILVAETTPQENAEDVELMPLPPANDATAEAFGMGTQVEDDAFVSNIASRDDAAAVNDFDSSIDINGESVFEDPPETASPESGTSELVFAATENEKASSASMNLRPKQYWRAPNVTESVAPRVEKVDGLNIFSAHVIDDSFRSSTMLGETLDDQIQHMIAAADEYDLMKFIILQRRGEHERDIQSFEIVLAPDTSADIGWTLYNMDKFSGHKDVDDGILGGSIFVGPNELAEVTVNYVDSTERIGTGTPIQGNEETVIRCANRGAEWYVNGELVAATPQFRRGICANGIPAPYVGIQKGLFRFTKIELVDIPAKRPPAGLISGDTSKEPPSASIEGETRMEPNESSVLNSGGDDQVQFAKDNGTVATENPDISALMEVDTDGQLNDNNSPAFDTDIKPTESGSTDMIIESNDDSSAEVWLDESGVDSVKFESTKMSSDITDDSIVEKTTESALDGVDEDTADSMDANTVLETETDRPMDTIDDTSSPAAAADSLDKQSRDASELAASVATATVNEELALGKKTYLPTRNMKNVTTSGYLGELTTSSPPSELTTGEVLYEAAASTAAQPVSAVSKAESESNETLPAAPIPASILSLPDEQRNRTETAAAASQVSKANNDSFASSMSKSNSNLASFDEQRVFEAKSSQSTNLSAAAMSPDMSADAMTGNAAPAQKKSYAPGGGTMRNVTTFGYLGDLNAGPKLEAEKTDSIDESLDLATEASSAQLLATEQIENTTVSDGTIKEDQYAPTSNVTAKSLPKKSYSPTRNMKNVTTTGYLGELAPKAVPPDDQAMQNIKEVTHEPPSVTFGSIKPNGVLQEPSPVYLRQVDYVAKTPSKPSQANVKQPEPVLVASGGGSSSGMDLKSATQHSNTRSSGLRKNGTTSGYLGEMSSNALSPSTVVDRVKFMATETSRSNVVHGEGDTRLEQHGAINASHDRNYRVVGGDDDNFTSNLREFSAGPKRSDLINATRSVPADISDTGTVPHVIPAPNSSYINVASKIKQQSKAKHGGSEVQHGHTSKAASRERREDGASVTDTHSPKVIDAPQSLSGSPAKAPFPFFFAEMDGLKNTEEIAHSKVDVAAITDEAPQEWKAAENATEIRIAPPPMDIQHAAERVVHKVEHHVAHIGKAMLSETAKGVETFWAKIKESKPFRPIPIPDVKDIDLTPELDTKGMTERIMKRLPQENQASGAGGISTWDGFLKAEENWSKLKESKAFRPVGSNSPPQFVVTDGTLGNPKCWEKLRMQRNKKLDYDVVVCGGTLGIFFATALQLKGLQVAVLEAGKLRGREQEWNISMDELLELKKLGVLSQEDIDAAIKTQFPGCRSGFKNMEVTPLEQGYFENGIGYECVTKDVLNLGISPATLIERVGQRFKDLGGVIREDARLYGVTVSDNVGSALDLGADMEPITSSLVLDCMGNASPITRQQRWGMKPDGVCAVVGSCAGGYDKETNLIGDIIYTNTEIQDKGEEGMLQYFWEAFPVGIGRDGKEPGTSDVKTTYMFTYMDASRKRPSLETLMEDYWKLLPKYQRSIKNPETDLDIKRVLFAYFPTYRDSPLQSQWNRVLAVGDASGIQSPLSFGGFGALTRHLDRISTAVSEAVQNECLSKDQLSEINAYTPNLSAAWMFQKAMSVRMGQKVDPKFINRLLAGNFEVMDNMGERTIKPFLQDIVKIDSLVGSLARSFVADPTFMPEIVKHVGIPTLVEWIGHVGMMGLYTALDTAVSPILKPLVKNMEDPKEQFQWRRRMEAWKFGSGRDYVFSPGREE